MKLNFDYIYFYIFTNVFTLLSVYPPEAGSRRLTGSWLFLLILVLSSPPSFLGSNQPHRLLESIQDSAQIDQQNSFVEKNGIRRSESRLWDWLWRQRLRGLSTKAMSAPQIMIRLHCCNPYDLNLQDCQFHHWYHIR